MEPEISRRCLTCGASVRGTAFFCPECGKPLKVEPANIDSAEAVPEATAFGTFDPNAQSSSAVVEPAVAVAESVAVETVEPAATAISEPSKRSRVKTAAREAVEAKITPRVEKLRQASNVMLEEASDDPNLRFVLIAIAIFIIALLFLWLNHLLG